MQDQCLSEQEATRIRAAVKGRYRAVAARPGGAFPYPVGRESALGLGYESGLVASIPAEVVERFVGVGNPFSLHRPCDGDRVLDVGCGCGFDSFVASALTGARGSVAGVVLTPEMLEVARKGLASWLLHNMRFSEDSAEELPFEDESFDLVISNGALNLVSDKVGAFRQIRRVLRPGGRFVAADVLVDEVSPGGGSRRAGRMVELNCRRPTG